MRIKKEYRDKILERDNYQCVYCGSKENLGVDHKIPRSLGGSDSLKNLVTACKSCDSEKNARLGVDIEEQVLKYKLGESKDVFSKSELEQVEQDWFWIENEAGDLRGILELNEYEFLRLCNEYHMVKKTLKRLLALADREDTPARVKMTIYKWLLEMNLRIDRERSK